LGGHERALRAICTEEREKLRALRVDVGLEFFPDGEFEDLDEEVCRRWRIGRTGWRRF
jgi:hypothetical protein